MAWFDSQIEERNKHEKDLLSDSFQKIAQSITGEKMGDGWYEEGADVSAAITQLLKYFNVKEKETPAKYKDLEDKLDYQLASSGVMYREVILEKGWRGEAMGAMIGTWGENGTVVTLLPQHSGGYGFIDPNTGRKIRVNASVEKQIGKQAFCFYKPLPMRKLGIIDLFKFMLGCLTTWDLVSFAISAAVIVAIGWLIPKLSYLLTGDVVSYNSVNLLMAVMFFMMAATVGNVLFSGVKQLLLSRISIKLNINVTSASMMRVLSLPSNFFKDYSAGELSEYLKYMNSLCSILVDSFLSTGLTGLLSLVYLAQIFHYAKCLVLPSILVTVLSLIVSMASAAMQTVISKQRISITAKENGLTFSLISGIRKIRLSGAENRAFSKWASLYSEEARLTFNPPGLIKLSTVLTTAISLIGTIIIYYMAVENSVTVAEYYAFNSSYAYISSAFTALASVIVSAGTIKPILEIIKPLLEAEPESQEGREVITRLSGGVEFAHVSFRYDKDGPLIVDDLNLVIPPKQYVAIVGKTGCGKSTLMRLLLGFEEPTEGSIFYDKKDTKRLDMRSVRKNIGTVMQDGKLFSGSMFENITISDPTLTLEDAWEAAEVAGIADDIRHMPMGMNTLLSEGGGGVSGGQRQRIMIARAVAPKPKLLLLDEATSALDNITQKQVADALDKMKSTRIVIAHRLSTIRHCDRILVLDGGKIIEDGTYEELIAADGFFAELVARQRV